MSAPSEYRDYRRQSVGAGDAPLERQKSDTSARRGKNYADLTKSDLEAEAEDNQHHPLGKFVGDRHVKGREGPEEGYIGGDNPFGGGPRGRRHEFDEKATYNETHGGDIGQAYSSPQEEEGYYAAPRRDRPFSPSTEQTYVNDQYAPKQTRSNRQAPTTLNYDPNDRSFVHPHEIPTYPTQNFYRRCVLNGFQLASWGITALSFNMIVVMALIWSGGQAFKRLIGRGPKPAKVEKEWEQRISGERFSSRAEYYAEYFGYECELLEVETEDGFVLRVHHLMSKKHKQLGHPVILQHGILSNSTTFMVNEERSLAFWLMEQGYDVYLSNIRTNFKMPHRTFPRSDPRYWAWSIEQIGIYDLPAIVDFVSGRTGKKPAYIGHSQGTGTMFLALSRGMRPDIGNKLSCFIALSPAVYGGPVLRSFPFSMMRRFKSRRMWKLIFGCREFIPVLGLLQEILPSWLFGHVGAPVFCFLFGFNTSQWLQRQIPKYFRTVAVPNSSELLYYYMSKLSYNNCIFETETREPWFPASFPPLAIFYGLDDTLVLGRPLVERIRQHEPNVELLHVSALENTQHNDTIWGVNAPVEVFADVKKVIEATKDR